MYASNYSRMSLMRFTTSTILISGFALSLTACVSVPSQNQLMTGIDSSKITQNTVTKLAATDPTCVNFYNNVNTFQKEAQKAQGSKNFMTSLGLNVLVSVATAGIIPAGLSPVGQIAASTAASSVTSQGSQIALRQLNSTNRADAKIIETAAQIGCPVSIAS